MGGSQRLWTRVDHPCCGSGCQVSQLKPADSLMGAAAGDGTSQPASSAESKSAMKKKKPMKIAMEAMIRGFQKFVEEEEEPTPSSEHVHNVAAWHNVPHPEERLRFWSDPDTELMLAKNTGVSVFRMGVDWSRIMPSEPSDGLKETFLLSRLILQHWSDISGSSRGFAHMG